VRIVKEEAVTVRHPDGSRSLLAVVARFAVTASVALFIVWLLGGLHDLPNFLAAGVLVAGAIAITRASRARFGTWRVALVTSVAALAGGALIGRFNGHFGWLFPITCLFGLLIVMLDLPRQNKAHV
jgi:hypothetical protein